MSCMLLDAPIYACVLATLESSAFPVMGSGNLLDVLSIRRRSFQKPNNLFNPATDTPGALVPVPQELVPRYMIASWMVANHNAYNARYRDRGVAVPTLEDCTKWILGGEKVPWLQCYKHLQCIGYQLAEDVYTPEHQVIRDEVDAITKAVGTLILTHLPEYERIPWGSPDDAPRQLNQHHMERIRKTLVGEHILPETVEEASYYVTQLDRAARRELAQLMLEDVNEEIREERMDQETAHAENGHPDA